MTSLKPSERERKRLAKRTEEQLALINKITPKRLLKSPSQKHSEAGRKRLNRGAVAPQTIPDDCRGCTQLGKCGKTLNNCEERSMVLRCKKCGTKVRARIIEGVVWETCPVCRG